MFDHLDDLTVTFILQRSVKPRLLCRTKHKQNQAFVNDLFQNPNTYIFLTYLRWKLGSKPI